MMIADAADFWPLFAEVIDANQQDGQDLSFESFEKDIGDIFEFDPASPFPDSFPILLPGTPPGIRSPSSSTYSTYSTGSDSPSQHSYDFAPSEDYSTASDVVTPAPSVYTAHSSVYPDIFTHDPSSFGSLPPSPLLHPIKAQSDYGTSLPYQAFFGTSPEELSVDLPQPAMSPAFLSMQVMPGTQTNETSDKPFKCPYCPHGK
jgi:hypothetical protein